MVGIGVGRVVVGVDAHKRTHTLVAVDQVGRKLAERTVAATSDGHLQAVRWAAQWPQPQVTFALEDCRHLTRRLEADLLRAGHRVVRVPTRLMAAARRSAASQASPTQSTRWRSPRPRCATRPACRPPRRPDSAGQAAGRLPRRPGRGADHAVQPAALAPARARPGAAVPSRGLRRYKVIDQLAARLAGVDGTVAQIARELLARCRELTVRINQLERDLRDLVRVLAPGLVAIPAAGCWVRRPSWGRPPAPPGSAPGCLCPLQRHRPDPGVVRQQRAGAAQPRRQPHRQLGAAHDRRDPGPRRRARRPTSSGCWLAARPPPRRCGCCAAFRRGLSRAAGRRAPPGRARPGVRSAAAT